MTNERRVGGSLSETDQQLYLASITGDTAEQQRLTTESVYKEFWATPIGQKLASLSADSELTLKRLLSVFYQRFGEDSPLYIHRLEDIAEDLVAADAEAAPVPVPEYIGRPEPSEAEKHAALVEQVRRDMEDPNVSSVMIRARRKESVAYERAFQAANTPEAEPSKPEAPAEIKSFAHMLNQTIRELGVPRLIAGVLTLKIGDKSYRYKQDRFLELSEEAAKFGLIE